VFVEEFQIPAKDLTTRQKNTMNFDILLYYIIISTQRNIRSFYL